MKCLYLPVWVISESNNKNNKKKLEKTDAAENLDIMLAYAINEWESISPPFNCSFRERVQKMAKMSSFPKPTFTLTTTTLP